MSMYERYGFDKNDTFESILKQVEKIDLRKKMSQEDVKRYYKALQRTANTRLNSVKPFGTNAVRALNRNINKFGGRDLEAFNFKYDDKMTIQQQKRELKIMVDFLKRPSSKASWEKKHREKISNRIFDKQKEIHKKTKTKRHTMTVPESQVEFDVYRRLKELKPLVEAREYESDTILSEINVVINEQVYKSYFKRFKGTVPIGKNIRDSKKYQEYIDSIAQDLKTMLEYDTMKDVWAWKEISDQRRKEAEERGQKTAIRGVSSEYIMEILQHKRQDRLL